ncbi:uncharacterized protein L199_003638 [Kwoniella botswanensis]|uniref:uncharacterized protein n=1 Tax=Kwoniella botswanensis TaxID=1268659 RepID=UPI00315D9FE5
MSWYDQPSHRQGLCQEFDSVVKVKWRDLSSLKRLYKNEDLLKVLPQIELSQIPQGAVRLYSIEPTDEDAHLHDYPAGSNRPQPRESIEAVATLQEALCRSSESESFGDVRIELYSELTNYNPNDARQMKMVVPRDNPLYTNIHALTRNKRSDGLNSSIWQCNTVHVNDDFSRSLTDCISQVTFDPLPRDVTKEVANYPFDLHSIDKISVLVL